MDKNFSIFQCTQQEYVDKMAALLKRGRRHAALLYAEWFRKGRWEGLLDKVEPQARALVEEMVALTDFSLPILKKNYEEAETHKFLLEFEDGEQSESVLIPMQSTARRYTLCLSSQVGCRMGCTFCTTGSMGLIRHLTRAEIVAQVFFARFVLKVTPANLVFMGMGEPFDNYEEVIGAVRILTDPKGYGLGPSRITISTSGRVDGIYRMIDEVDPALNLAVSVNAPNDAVRKKIMPVNRKWDMAALKEAMRAYCQHPRRKIFVEYVLIQGVNDSLDNAEELADYLEGLRVTLNLIPYNLQPLQVRFFPPEEAQMQRFLERMRARGYLSLIRGTKGRAIMAACGQLGLIEKIKVAKSRPVS